ncbi:MAG: hypothetical protein JWR61_4538 [Ferruginibacter sp.]|uniref:PIG-L family deacetylase n=1 Tax=Ferruginibacter sp. TaxID=1940288 RepID=UPI00265A5305|nr:PIG-L family deacetylase [Ferruginibacter sp.]MDB5279583.1 hypothetical protein [Ferruginibacter sp.]
MKTSAETALYIIAHSDDWQLFMMPNILNELLDPACKIVLIITTAGDAGLSDSFWKAREEGSNSSIRFCHAAFSIIEESTGFKLYNGRTINYSVINNTTSYFLRLPDGGLNGDGFAYSNYKSISKLEQGSIHEIEAIDGSAIYYGWTDLVNTIATIINTESEKNANCTLNYLNPSNIENPNDHPDHGSTGRAVQAGKISSFLKQRLYVGYSLTNSAELLTNEDLFWKSGMMAAYDKAIFDKCGYSTLKENVSLYINWCKRPAKYVNIFPFNK